MYNDYLDHKAQNYLEEIGSGTELEQDLRNNALDPEFDMKENLSFKESLKNIERVEL